MVNFYIEPGVEDISPHRERNNIQRTIFCESDLRDTLRTVFCEEHYRSDSELFKNPVIHGPIGYHFVQDCSTTATPITSDILLKF